MITNNWSYTINDSTHPHNGQTLWSGRYCAVVGFVFKQVNNDWFILANKRSNNTPDYQGYWNCPCGYLECNETGEEGVSREVLEETGVYIKPFEFTLYNVETDPKICNRGNVSLRYWTFNPDIESKTISTPNEVEEVKWINLFDIKDYKWAFNHDNIIYDIWNILLENQSSII